MLVTVAICTWNRARLLHKTLSRMCSLRIPGDVDWELLVINNNCTDDTEAVVASFADRLPIRHIIEHRQGQSHARNCAHDAAKGELLIWTDDDVLVDEDWLAAYVGAAHRWPNAGYFGGLIVPWFEHDPPGWIVENRRVLEGILVARDLGPMERPFLQNEWPYGASMAFRLRSVRGYSFDPNLGLTGDNAIRGDETEYCKTLQRSGIQGVWVPSAAVQHFVVARRMTLKYVWAYHEGFGRAQARIGSPQTQKMLFGAPRWLYRQYVQACVAFAFQRVVGNKDWLRSYIEAAEALGAIRERQSQRVR